MAFKELEEQVKQIDSRLKGVEAYLDAFKEHNRRLLQWAHRGDSKAIAPKGKTR